MKCLLNGHKINIGFARMILQYPHLKHKMPIGFFGWCVQHSNVGHKIFMLNEKNDDNKKLKTRKKTNCDK